MSFKYIYKSLFITVLSFLFSWLGLFLAIKSANIMLIWPASGISLGLFLVFGANYWPSIFLASVLAFLVQGYALQTSVIIGAGATLSVLLGCYLVKNTIGMANYLININSILKFTLYVGFFSPVLTALFGVSSLYMAGIIHLSEVWKTVFEWWFSNAVGIIIVTPLVLTWADKSFIIWNNNKRLEYALVLFLIAFTGYMIFGGLLAENALKSLTFKYLLLPFYFWLIYRFSQREIATATFIVAIVGVCSTYLNFQNKAEVTSKELIMSLEFFLSFIIIVALILWAIVYERKKIMEDVARLDRLNLIGEMAASFAHELRNPMTVVRGYIQLVAKKTNQAEQKEIFYTIISELDRANSIITEYLLLAQNRTLDLKKKNINEIINTLAPLMAADATHQNSNLELKLGNVPDFYLDEKEIRQLILNIVRNGLEAMSPGGTLAISTYVENNRVVLAIKDQGKGIPKEVINKLGTPFLTTKENGTGLGLAVSFSIATRHNAGIKVDSSPEGTVFNVSFNCN